MTCFLYLTQTKIHWWDFNLWPFVHTPAQVWTVHTPAQVWTELTECTVHQPNPTVHSPTTRSPTMHSLKQNKAQRMYLWWSLCTEDVPLVEFMYWGCTSGGVYVLRMDLWWSLCIEDVPLVEFMYWDGPLVEFMYWGCTSGGVYVLRMYRWWSLCIEDRPLMELMYLVFTHMPGELP